MSTPPLHPSSPQQREMADESMVRNLAAQAEAIWPQEAPLFSRAGLPHHGRVLDVGCGTGEILARLAELFPSATLVGVDLEAAHLERARSRTRAFADRCSFELGDALALPYPDASFDLVVCRHVLQAVPDPARVTAELKRVTRPGGRLHVLAEDYGMLWCHPTLHDSDDFWQRLPQIFGAAIGCDNHIGRKMFAVLTGLGLTEVKVDYAVVDTVRVPRDTFARIWEAWRDGYAQPIATHTGLSQAEVTARFQEMIDCARSPQGYALWQVPIWSARQPQ